MKRHRIQIYNSRWHLLATFSFLAAPLVFLIFFSRFAHIATSMLLNDVWVSFLRILIAYAISVVIAWTCAILFYRGARAAVALPIFDVLQSLPTFAALPIAVYYLGPSNFTVIMFLVLAIVWPIFFSVLSSMKLIKHEWEEAVAVSHLSSRSYLEYFLIPVSIPGLITGSIIGLGDGWEALVATEIIVALPHGLGSFFQQNSHNIPITVFGILGFLMIVFSINKLVWLPLLDWSHSKME